MQITCKFYANDPFLLYPHPLNSWRAFSESSQIFAPRSCCPQTVLNLDPSWGPSGLPVLTSDPLGRTSRKSLAPSAPFLLEQAVNFFCFKDRRLWELSLPFQTHFWKQALPLEKVLGEGGGATALFPTSAKWTPWLQALGLTLISCHVSWIELSGLGEGWRSQAAWKATK